MPGKRALGSTLGYGTSSGGTFTAIANITKISGPKTKADAIDVSSMDSPSNYREKLAGLLDAGTLTLDINFDDLNAGHQTTLSNLGVSQYFQLTFPAHTTASKMVFAGFISETNIDLPDDNKMTDQITITVSGPITFTAGT